MNNDFEISIGNGSKEFKKRIEEKQKNKEIGNRESPEVEEVPVQINEYNLNNCLHRSEHTEWEEKACCMQAAQRKEGYICNLLAIMGVTAPICETCEKFKQKEISKE